MPDISIDYRYGLNQLSGPSALAYTRADPATRTTRGGLIETVPAGRFRTHWITDNVGVRRGGLLTEGARTNIALHNRDLTQAAWVKTDVTAARDALGVDGLANNASRLTATAGNATCLQTVTLASSERFMTAWVRRVTGSGVIEMTTNGGTNWDPITITAQFTRVSIPTRTVTNPEFGFRIVTSGDVIVVDFIQNENGIFSSSEIAVSATAVIRATDQVSYANFPQPAEIAARGGITVYHRFVELGTRNISLARYWQLGVGTAPRILRVIANVNATLFGATSESVSTSNVSPGALGDVVESSLEMRYTAGTDTFAIRLSRSTNKDTVVSSPYTSELAAADLIANGWATAPTLFVGQRDGSANPGFQLNQVFAARFGIHDLETMRSVV